MFGFHDLLLHTDGKFTGAVYTHFDHTLFGLMRVRSDGHLDTAWGSGGLVTTAFGTGPDSARTLLQQTDGKFVLAGYSRSDRGVVALARYSTDGTLDNSFGTNGLARSQLGTDGAQGGDAYFSNGSFGLTAAILPDGRILVGGSIFNGQDTDLLIAAFWP